jgi:hypothetical protein
MDVKKKTVNTVTNYNWDKYIYPRSSVPKIYPHSRIIQFYLLVKIFESDE